MKPIFALIICAWVTPAFSSYFQDNCSNTDQTVFVSQGHDSTEVILSLREWQDGHLRWKRTWFDRYEMQVDFSEGVTLGHTEDDNCTENADWGTAWGETVTYKEVTIRKRDGSPFTEDFQGLSEDKTTITANVLCKHQHGGERPCN